MFNEFQSGDVGVYLSALRFMNNFNLVKCNSLEEVKEATPSNTTDELHKAYDGGEEYSEYLSKRRGEMSKDIPLFKMVNTEIKETDEIKDIVKLEDRLFKNVNDFEEFETGEFIKKRHMDEINQMPANQMWAEEHNKNVLSKTIEIINNLYNEVVEHDSAEEKLKTTLLEKGMTEDQATVVAKTLYKMKESKDADMEPKDKSEDKKDTESKDKLEDKKDDEFKDKLEDKESQEKE